MSGLQYALRTLRQTPFVTAVAVLSLALGIGANAAIFSLFDQILLRPIPVRAPGELVNLSAPGPKPGAQSCGTAGSCEAVFSYPMFRDLERASTTRTVLSGLAAHVHVGANLAVRGRTKSAGVTLVSGSYFPTLGLTPALGRLLGPADDQTIGAHPLAVLSDEFWTTTLGRDPDILGQTIVVNGQSMTIVGVAPRGFAGTTLGVRPAAFVPLTMREQLVPAWKVFENRRAYLFYLFGRLEPGVTREQAARGLNAVYRPILAEVEAPLQKSMSAATMARFRAKAIAVTAGPHGQSATYREAKTPLVLLFAITGIVLLIACANIANLLLARGASRAGEMAVRLSLGAERGRLVRQLLAESLVLGAAGGLAGLLVASWTLSGIAALLPADSRTFHAHLDAAVVGFAALIAVVTSVLFGLVPALHSTRSGLIGTIRSSAGQLSGAKSAARFRTSLVTSQIALSMTLLVCAGLFIRSLVNVSRIDLGIATEHVVTFGVAPELNGYASARSAVLFDRLEQELAAMPGVTGVTATLVPLLAGNSYGTTIAVEGFRHDPDADMDARYNEVGPSYFQTLGTPLLAGRAFTAADVAGAPQVAIVNETFAKKFGLGRQAVGRHMAMGRSEDAERRLDIEIVGLMRDAKYADVKGETPPLFLLPYKQDSTVGAMNFYVRTTLPPQQLVQAIPRVVAALDPMLPVDGLKTMPQQIREQTYLGRMIGILSVSFAVVATLLAAVGLYGVLSYTVARRTREIGVRMALGADGGRVRGLVLRQVAWMTLVGGGVGVAAAIGLGVAAKSLLYGLAGWDPLSIGLSGVVLALVAHGAGYLPARRASKVEPIRALRYE